jgi:2Fe-2S ferredoxin
MEDSTMVIAFYSKSRTGELSEQLVEPGATLMSALQAAGKVDAICGGSMSCGTCAVQIETPWSEQLEAPSDTEQMLLEGLGIDGNGCRLSCQIVANDKLNGMIVAPIQAS